MQWTRLLKSYEENLIAEIEKIGHRLSGVKAANADHGILNTEVLNFKLTAPK